MQSVEERQEQPSGCDDVPLFPSGRAFVVQFVRDAQVDTEGWRGRVEHIVSGRSARFTTSTDIIAFMNEILGSESR